MNTLPSISKKTYRLGEGAQTTRTEIELWNEGAAHTPGGRGIYNYYIYIYERHHPEFFKEHWLEDEVTEWNHVTHDYYSLPCLAEVDFHGGITFYAKHGHTLGHRAIQLGCDFNHSWDHDSPPTLSQVVNAAMKTTSQMCAYLRSLSA